MKRADTRRHERAAVEAPAKLKWAGASGEARFGRGKVVNLSTGGVCIELSEPIRTCSYVLIDAPDLRCADWSGAGAVRHCEPKGMKFRIGLELTTDRRSNS